MLQFPKATLMDALQRYSIRNPESTAPKNKIPDSSIAKASQLFERTSGVQDTDNFLTLTWCTVDNLKKPQMSQRLKYLFDDSKGASTKEKLALNTLRTTLEEARAIVYAAARHVDANGDDQNPAHVAQKRHLAKAYQEFGAVVHPLREELRAQRDRRHKSERQKKNWSDLDDIRRAVAGQARLFLRQADVADTRKAWNDMQQLVAACLYVLIPPSRKDIIETAFVDDPSQDNIDDLISNGIANYIDMSSDKPAIIINAHKTSRLRGELVDDHERTRRFPVTGTMQQTETLAKLGFDVDLCAKVLVHYAGLIERHLGARNPLRSSSSVKSCMLILPPTMTEMLRAPEQARPSEQPSRERRNQSCRAAARRHPQPTQHVEIALQCHSCWHMSRASTLDSLHVRGASTSTSKTSTILVILSNHVICLLLHGLRELHDFISRKSRVGCHIAKSKSTARSTVHGLELLCPIHVLSLVRLIYQYLSLCHVFGLLCPSHVSWQCRLQCALLSLVRLIYQYLSLCHALELLCPSHVSW